MCFNNKGECRANLRACYHHAHGDADYHNAGHLTNIEAACEGRLNFFQYNGSVWLTKSGRSNREGERQLCPHSRRLKPIERRCAAAVRFEL